MFPQFMSSFNLPKKHVVMLAQTAKPGFLRRELSGFTSTLPVLLHVTGPSQDGDTATMVLRICMMVHMQ